jgi:DNA-binding response OmpR family regulator
VHNPRPWQRVQSMCRRVGEVDGVLIVIPRCGVVGGRCRAPTSVRLRIGRGDGALLGVLMSAPRRVFTRAQLLDAVFDGIESSSAVDTYVHYLRRKLGRNIVHTVHGTGYRLGSE